MAKAMKNTTVTVTTASEDADDDDNVDREDQVDTPSRPDAEDKGHNDEEHKSAASGCSFTKLGHTCTDQTTVNRSEVFL